MGIISQMLHIDFDLRVVLTGEDGEPSIKQCSCGNPRTTRYRSSAKAIPLQAWTGPKGSRRLRLPDFKTIGTWRW